MVDQAVPPTSRVPTSAVVRLADGDRPFGDRGRNPVSVHFDIGDLFAIHAINILLTIVTLGIYRFWAKTRMRRYLWSHVAFDDERMEYTGRAVELLIGFLIIAVLVLVPLIGSDIYVNNVLIYQNADLAAVISFVTLGFVFFMIQIALYRARRYRLTRTLWRGIRGGQTGAGWAYALRYFGFAVLASLTLGLSFPFGRTRLMAYKMGHTWFGDKAVTFTAPARGLYGTFIAVWVVGVFGFLVLGFILFLIPVMLGVTPIGDAVLHENLGHDLSLGAFFVGLLTALLYALWGLLMWAWYRSRELAHFARYTHYMDLTFGFQPKLFTLFRLWVGNWFISVLSLGFGAPWVYRRTARFIATHLVVDGDIDVDGLLQSRQERPGTGEGLADAFDVDGF